MALSHPGTCFSVNISVTTLGSAWGWDRGLKKEVFCHPFTMKGSGPSPALPIALKTTYPAPGVGRPGPVFGIPTMPTLYSGKAHPVLLSRQLCFALATT